MSEEKEFPERIEAISEEVDLLGEKMQLLEQIGTDLLEQREMERMTYSPQKIEVDENGNPVNPEDVSSLIQ